MNWEGPVYSHNWLIALPQNVKCRCETFDIKQYESSDHSLEIAITTQVCVAYWGAWWVKQHLELDAPRSAPVVGMSIKLPCHKEQQYHIGRAKNVEGHKEESSRDVADRGAA